MYVVSRPKALPGVPAPSGRVYSERAKAFLIPLLKVLGSNKTSKAIDGSRYILGVCSDAVERNGDFFFDGQFLTRVVSFPARSVGRRLMTEGRDEEGRASRG
jgi:hypothetical protein